MPLWPLRRLDHTNERTNERTNDLEGLSTRVIRLSLARALLMNPEQHLELDAIELERDGDGLKSLDRMP